MDLIFIRHGEGEHTLNLPASLQKRNPSLTKKGRDQANKLKERLPLTTQDIVFISPLVRTLETAMLWTDGVDCQKIVTPYVSPRMFPLLTNKQTLTCDLMMEKEKILDIFPVFELDDNPPASLWENGFNTVIDSEFTRQAEEFLANCRHLKKEKIYIVSHDGTITSYRQLILGRPLSRDDFPKETGWFQISC
ncbi:histidine phosphatase family protein [Niallia circulans]|uniref:histidine phosphatase family protein n=1 Tax=Niallia circulans TaxID=1397 RepID=UPI0015614B1E|nr:histidine phosphatase family protein [Niallia circulans]NRG34687.1 histidine phosphatase family protein [Niallia circulans]